MDAATDKRTLKVASIAAACLFVPLLIPLASGRVFSIGDLSDFHLPIRHLYASALASRESILWTDRMFNGFYIHAEGQAGALHPLHLLLYGLLPLTVAFNLEVISSYVFCFGGMWVLLRRFGMPSDAVLIGAIAFTFSGFNLLHLLHMNAVAVVAHIPWILLALDGLLFGDPRQHAASALWFSILIGSTLLLGYPQYVWMAVLICAIYVATNIRRVRVTALMTVLASALTGVMIGGIQLLPTFDLLRQSVRQAWQVTDGEFAFTYALHPINLVQLVSPYLLPTRVYASSDERFVHELGVYNGVFCTLATVWVLVRWRQLPFRVPARLGVALVTCGLVLALGHYGLLYRIVAALPLVGNFRAPARYIALVHLGLALLASVAFADLRKGLLERRREAPSRWIWLPLAFSIVAPLGVWLWFSGGRAFEGHAVDPLGGFVGVSLVCIVTLRFMDAWRGSREALIGLPVILSLDLGFWGYGYVLPGGVQRVSELAAQADGPPAASGATVHAPGPYSPNLLLLRDLRVVRPYVGLPPIRELGLTSSNEQRLAGVEWLQTADGWRPVPDPMERMRMVPEAISMPLPIRLQSAIDIRQTAIVDRAVPSLDKKATLTAISDSPGRMAADIVASGEALLATTEAFHAGWKARTDDGRELQTIRAYADYLAVLVVPGKYRLTLSFEPGSFRAGAYLSIAGLVSALILSSALRRLRNMRAATSPLPEIPLRGS